MDKSFEDKFSDLQTDMIAICLEYVERKADTIFIYASSMYGILSADCFFEVNHQLYYKHQLGEGYDTGDERQDECLDVLIDDMIQIQELCDQYHKEMPKEIKIIYRVKENKVKASYGYEEIPLIDDDLNRPETDWFNSIKETCGM